MREVQRLDDDVVLFWRALPEGLSLHQWRRLDPSKQDRERFVNRYAKTRIALVDYADDKKVAAAAPVDIPGHVWWLYGTGPGARQFSTTSGDLEPDDIWIGQDEVMYRKGSSDLIEANKDDLVITRDGQNRVTQVESKRGR